MNRLRLCKLLTKTLNTRWSFGESLTALDLSTKGYGNYEYKHK